jgi:hypothetical protein
MFLCCLTVASGYSTQQGKKGQREALSKDLLGVFWFWGITPLSCNNEASILLCVRLGGWCIY